MKLDVYSSNIYVETSVCNYINMSAAVNDPEDLETDEAKNHEADEASNLEADENLNFNFILEILKEITNKCVENYPMNSNSLAEVKKSQKVDKKVKFNQKVTIISQKASSNKEVKEVSQSGVSKDTTSNNKNNKNNKNDKNDKKKEAKNNLIKNFREAIKTQNNLIEVSDSEEAAKKETGRLAIATMNVAGLRSKALTVNNIARINQINAIVISETHYSSKTKPHLSSYYKVFHKNRDKYKNACKGGIAVFLDPLHADNAVVIDSGTTNEEEFITVKLNNYVPPVALFACYGPQQTVKNGDLDKLWSKFTNLWKKYVDQGLHVIICGDLNAAVGLNGGITRNDPSMNRAGINLLKAVEDLDLTILNSKEAKDQRTHIDRSSGLSRCLDYVITNNEKTCKEVVIDNNFDATPYKVIMRNNTPEQRKYTDHKTILTRFQLQPKPTSKPTPRTKFIKDIETRAKYALETENIADRGLKMIMNGDHPQKISNLIRREIKRAKYKSFKVIKSAKRPELVEDEIIYWHFVRELEKEVDDLQKMKLNNQIFEVRKKRRITERGDPLHVLTAEDGSIMDTKELIEDTLLLHNKNLLSRKEHAKPYSELHQMKRKLLDTLKETEIEEFESLTMDDYLKVVNKVLIKKKPMMMDFIDSSPRFKVFIYWILKLVYDTEQIPEEFYRTELVALFKKGSATDPNNYRFIHLKDWLPRLLEMCIHVKIDKVFDEKTPEAQTGGMKGADTCEHLVLMMETLNKVMAEGKGLVFTFADIRKCFDRVHLADAHLFLMRHMADTKAVKVLSILLDHNVISMQGSSKSFIIKGGLGQGGVTVGRSCAASISETMEKNVTCHPAPLHHNGVNVANQGYVDDTATTDISTEGVHFSCKVIEETFEEMSLEAHPQKTVNVVCGEPNWIKETKKKLEENPAKIQGFEVKIAQNEKYLGLKIVSGGIPDIIDANIKMKAGRVHQVATEIREEVRDPRIERIGALKAAALLIQSKIIPIMTYGCEAWLNVSNDQYKAMEVIMGEAMVRILSLPPNTNYDAMLMEMSNFHIEVWMDAMKLKYFMKKIHIKKAGKLYRSLREDIINDNNDGFIGDIRRLCTKYKIPDITTTPITTEFISLKCRELSRKRSMMTTLMLKKVPPMLTFSIKIFNEHYSFPKFEARAITALRTGNLIFKNWCPWKIRRQHAGDPYCMYQPCREKDTLQHVMECEFYSTKFISKDSPARDWSTYLVKLHQERMENFNQPLISCEGWSQGE